MPQLVERLYELYGTRWDFYLILNRLEQSMQHTAAVRNPVLQKKDEEFLRAEEKNQEWFLNQKEVGIMLYTDLFAGNLQNLITHIPYFKELGITYVHLMPVFSKPAGENDGGYAVKSYRAVDKSIGTIADLAETAAEFHAAGIRLVVDFVFNHTSDQHKWAVAARKGNKKYRGFYFIYKTKEKADSWNRTLREIFPSVRRGSFTYSKEAGGWVWTTFNSYQWDLNYSNPEVFLAMCEEMFFLANLGIDVLRLDALAFVWKEKGTVCESLPKAHTLIQAFQFAARIACPSLIFKSEAIVHPDQVIQYIKPEECRLSYNPLQMALFWSTLATRDTRLLTLSLKKRWTVPPECAWVNYIRCHDDIGWTFSDEDAGELGINGYDHRKFLNAFYTGTFPGSFGRGEPFQLNPATGDCRICGTTASLAGLEEAELTNNSLYRRMAAARIKMMYAVLFALPGIPLLYDGDQDAALNDYQYRTDKKKKNDSRWVHRSKHNWDTGCRYTSQKIIAEAIRLLIKKRKNEADIGGPNITFYDTQDTRVFAFQRNRIHVIANFSENTAVFRLSTKAPACTDVISGTSYSTHAPQKLGPYEVRWLKESQ
ncbi:MAG: alpha-amylase family protein [Treponema sp.]|jgi:amylosucrase|nr:alpha-amylase family protein [Treponema sp.]